MDNNILIAEASYASGAAELLKKIIDEPNFNKESNLEELIRLRSISLSKAEGSGMNPLVIIDEAKQLLRNNTQDQGSVIPPPMEAKPTILGTIASYIPGFSSSTPPVTSDAASPAPAPEPIEMETIESIATTPSTTELIETTPLASTTETQTTASMVGGKKKKKTLRKKKRSNKKTMKQ